MKVLKTHMFERVNGPFLFQLGKYEKSPSAILYTERGLSKHITGVVDLIWCGGPFKCAYEIVNVCDVVFIYMLKFNCNNFT